MARAVSERWRCRSCLGVYVAVVLPGMEYYHACPPLSGPEWARLPPDLQHRLHPGDDRLNKRNENIATDDQSRRVGIISPGDGAEQL